MSLWESIPQAYLFASYGWRMVMLILHAAKINDTSSETIRVLSDVPTDNTRAEIRYFREYLATSRVALTGRGYFALTKRLLLTVNQAFKAQ